MTVYSAEAFQGKFSSYSRFEDNVKVYGSVSVDGSSFGNANLPVQQLKVKGNMHFKKCHCITLPKEIKTTELKFEKCQGLTELRTTLKVASLVIDNCDKLKLPQTVPCSLTLNKYKHELPENLHVQGNFTIIHSKRLKSLPEGMKVDGNLVLEDFETLPAFPKNIAIKGRVIINFDPKKNLYGESMPYQIARLMKNLTVAETK